MRGVGILGIAAFGAYIMFPVAVLMGVLWFWDFVRTHHEQEQVRQAEQAAKIPRPIGPEIPRCDKPVWDRITDGCTGEDT